MSTVHRLKKGSRKSKVGRLSALALSCLLVAGNANAIFGIGDIVADPVHIASTIYQYGKDANAYREEFEHYRQQLINIQGLAYEVLSGGMGSLTERPANYRMADRCPGTTSISGAASMFLNSLSPLNKSGAVKAEQLKNCQKIVLADNARYNVIVRMFQTIKKRQRDLDRIASRRSSVGTKQGALEANSNDVERFFSQVTVDIQGSQSTISAYDAYIDSLKTDQQVLAKIALDGGSNDILTDVASGAARQGTLKAALDAARSQP